MEKDFIRHLNKFKIYNLRLSILLVLFLLFLTVVYFLFYVKRNQITVYVKAVLIKPQDIPLNVPYFWTPYWIDESISIGDTDSNPLGNSKASVLDKDSIDSINWGKIVNLLLIVQAVKDKSGNYLFNSKPLAVGTILNLNFPRSHINTYVNYIGNERPKSNLTKLRVQLKSINIDLETIDNIKIGDSIKNNKNETIAKIVSYKELPYTSASFLSNYAFSGSELELTIELLVDSTNLNYYFIDGQRIRQNESFYISFPNLTLDSNYTKITKVEKLNGNEID